MEKFLFAVKETGDEISSMSGLLFIRFETIKAFL